MKKHIGYFVLSVLLFCSCTVSNKLLQSSPKGFQSVHLPSNTAFQQTVEGKTVQLYVLKNKGITAAITNYGGRLVSLWVNDSKGQPVDVVLGYDSVISYRRPNEPVFGALIGRYANRIANAKFILNSKEYTLDKNAGPNSIHGGRTGFYKRVWEAVQPSDSTLVLTYISKDGEEGFPGNLTTTVTYTTTGNSGLQIDYRAITDSATVVNLTSHAYFNLDGEGSGSITDHVLTINADSITFVDKTLIPTGKMEKVQGTPLDFTHPVPIGSRIGIIDSALKRSNGYDHNYVLRKSATPLNLAATVFGPKTGIIMQVYTTEPGVQFYTANYLNERGKGGKIYKRQEAFCLETQHYPDSPNHPQFPTTILLPGQIFNSTTVYQFTVSK